MEQGGVSSWVDHLGSAGRRACPAQRNHPGIAARLQLQRAARRRGRCHHQLELESLRGADKGRPGLCPAEQADAHTQPRRQEDESATQVIVNLNAVI